MKRVVIESPYAGEVEENVAYAKRCVGDCLKRGESPYASHLFFTQSGMLDDLKPEERELGIKAGFAWGKAADTIVFYIDRGISGGMLRGVTSALENNKNIEVRSLERKVLQEDLGKLGLIVYFNKLEDLTREKIDNNIESEDAKHFCTSCGSKDFSCRVGA